LNGNLLSAFFIIEVILARFDGALIDIVNYSIAVPTVLAAISLIHSGQSE